MSFSLSPLFAGFFVVEWCIRILMLLIVPRRRRPSSANAWLLLIMIFPMVGVVIFYMFGNPKLPKVRRQKMGEVEKLTQKELTELCASHPRLFPVIKNEDYETLARLASALGGLPAMSGNSVSLISGYEGAFQEIASEIDRATDHVHVEYFIAALDEITKPVFDALERAAARGVKVRFLYDRLVSSRYRGHAAMRRVLDSAEIEYREMLPLRLVPGKRFTRPDLRNHRKLVVVDGRVAFTGSQNLITKTYNRRDGIYYEETTVRLEGPVVWQYNNVFRADWFAETSQPLLDVVEDTDMPVKVGSAIVQVLPSGPDNEHQNNLKFYTSMVHAAKKSIGIVVPYFIPDESFLDALTAAAQRGVKVTMINSEVIDKLLAGHAQRSYYEELLEAGVNIHLYKKPVFLHTKQLIIDEQIAIIGSSNLDIRSFELDLELSTVLYGRAAVAELVKMEKQYMKRCTPITLDDWRARSFGLKAFDNLARLTSALQ